MENISRRLSNEDTATSMYLSFDAESTMSTACYKTLDAMTDMSASDLDESGNNLKESDNHNSTLEANANSIIKSPLKTVKKLGVLIENKTKTPLMVLSKNIMNEFKALSSTPSKEQLLKTVDVTRGSDANRCIDLGLAFLGVEDEEPAYFPPSDFVRQNEDNKENTRPDNEEVSTLSTCSSVEGSTTSIIERKIMSSVSTVNLIHEEEEVIKDVNTMITTNDISYKLNCEKADTIASAAKDLIQDKEAYLGEMATDKEDCTPKCDVKNVMFMATITESPEKPLEVEECKNNEQVRAITKPKENATALNLRRSICEPNLQFNKPSRILNHGDNKRKSLLPTSKKSNLALDAETEIPLLMSKMLKISKVSMEMKEESDKKLDGNMANEKENLMTKEKQRSVATSTKGRSSLIPSTTGGKRPLSFTHRMSVVVKTTLNSPARKVARKSLMGGVPTSFPRRSVIPQKPVSTESSNMKKPELLTRKTMLPKNSTISLDVKTNSESRTSILQTETKTKTLQRNSLMSSTTSKAERTKQDVVYTCSFCKEKFRIKSLLDAHKRSHESDNITPPFVKKPTVLKQSSGVSLLGNANQCKFCDKKFALIKALHIHLLQNCSKIPPSEKKKLHYTDLNHVEKAQLPNVFNTFQNNVSNAVSSVNSTPRNAQKCDLHTINEQKNTTDAISVIKDKATNLDGNNHILTQGSVQKPKKITAHTGVYKTPSKSVPCHLCKTNFKSILAYTNHNLTMHGKVNKAMEN